MKRICLLTSRDDIIKIVLEKFSGMDITILSDINEEQELCIDLAVVIDYKGEIPEKFIKDTVVIKVHPSLLPAFEKESAIKDAYLAGVKVTGVTICELNKDNSCGRIITQYPVLIDNYTHYDQLENEIKSLEGKLLPPVIKSILEDKIFDIVDFLNDKPKNGCGGCGNCSGCSQ